ncbi:MAG: redox-active protein [Planctomycetia bacterium]|nr:redox-active protein [Planctomycetia bacterium]
MNRASEIFAERAARKINCAQAIMAGLGHDSRVAEMADCGGGRAPEGRCGALHAAILLLPEAVGESVIQEFAAVAGSDKCREIKRNGFPCAKCVALAAELVEKHL